MFYCSRSRLATFEGWKDVIEYIYDFPIPALPTLNPNIYINNRPMA